jgi:hypothetical protein
MLAATPLGSSGSFTEPTILWCSFYPEVSVSKNSLVLKQEQSAFQATWDRRYKILRAQAYLEEPAYNGENDDGKDGDHDTIEV